MNDRKRGKFTLQSAVMLAIFIVMAVIILTPFISIFLASLRPGREIMRQGIGLNLDASVMSADNYLFLFTGDTPYFTWFKNSLIITAAQTVLTLVVSAFVGYIYRLGWEQANFGYGSAIGLTLLAIVLTVTLIQLKFAGLFKKDA